MSLLDQILEVCSAEQIERRDYVAIAEVLSTSRVKVISKIGGIGLILETLGPEDGALLLDDLQAKTATTPALKWAWYLIERGELDFGSTATRDMINKLVASPAKEYLLAVAEKPDTVTADQVEVAMKNDDGSFKI